MAKSPPEALIHAHESWLAAQKRAAEILLSAPQPGTPQDWAEGYRWLTRIGSLVQDWILEKEDPLRPELFRCQGPYRKLIGDNPDVNYYFASLDPSQHYRLSGTRGGALYVGLSVGSDIFRGAQGAMGTLAQHHLDEFPTHSDGQLEVFLGPVSDAPAVDSGNFIPLPPGSAQLAVRETFGDRSTEEPARLYLERMGERISAPRADPDVVAEKLEVAAKFLVFVTQTCVAMYAGSETSINQLGGAPGSQHVEAQDDAVRTHSNSEMVYIAGRWKVDPGKALRIRIRPPDQGFVYWGFVILNPWLESYDFRHIKVATNNVLAEAEADGSWELFVSDADPGKPNWIDTNGRHEGFMLLRWVRVESAPPTPECEIVDTAILAD